MEPKIKIAIGSDHAGFEIKEIVVELLRASKYDVKDYGTFSKESVDYPDFAHPVAKAVNDNVVDYGILICGSGNGVAMTANKYPEVRAALCWNMETAKLARNHNDANIIALPARYLTPAEAIEIINTFIKSGFDGGRHWKRIHKIQIPV
jgi:ribose 5-phosphate isomerase B